MSSTRRTNDPSKFKQWRFASSAEFERGLMANLVAARCSLLADPAAREVIWFLQYLSHQPGGMKQVAADLIAQFPHCVATPVMQAIGFKPGQIYNAKQVKTVRDETGGDFPLRGELATENTGLNVDDLLADTVSEHTKQRAFEQRLAESKLHPISYPAAAFVALCQEAAASHLEKHLLTLCLDPAIPVADGSPWYFPTLVSTVRAFMAEKIAARQRQTVVTSLGQLVHDALDYTSQTGCLSLIVGKSRLGKSHSAEDWCHRHPGRARYVELESCRDDMSFYREIARVLGVSINLNSKAQQLRLRIEETLRCGDLMLVIDEAHFLWPNLIDSRTLPERIEWVRTALVNKGVPVALVATPQFFRNQKEIETRTRWASEQLTGRIGHYQKLPDELSIEDMQAVARALLPKADSKSISALVIYAKRSDKYLAAIKAVSERANYIARKSGRECASQDDIRCAMKEDVIPSDSAFTAALGTMDKPARRRAIAVPPAAPAEPLQSSFSREESPLQAPDLLRARSGFRSASTELVH